MGFSHRYSTIFRCMPSAPIRESVMRSSLLTNLLRTGLTINQPLTKQRNLASRSG